MTIKYGDIEYFELLTLQDNLRNHRYDKFGLDHLDKLRIEVARRIGAINLEAQNKKAQP
jgi:hypothetical protein